MDKKIIAIIAAIVVVFVLVIGGMFWWVKNIEKTVKNPATTGTSQTATPLVVQNESQAGQTAAVPGAKDNNDGVIEWYPSPKPASFILSQDTKDNPGYKCWEVGKITKGPTQGGKIIDVESDSNGPGAASTFRFIQQIADNGGKLDFLMHYSSDDALNYWTSVDESVVNPYADGTTRINPLDFPGILYTPKGEKMVLADNFPAAGTSDKYDDIFFQATFLKKAFADPLYGDFYTTDSSKVKGDVNAGIYGQYGFYVKASDGTFKVYTMPVNFMSGSDIPNVVWDGGMNNSFKFTYQGATGCGTAGYFDVVDNEIGLNDLAPAGKTSTGDTIFEYKDKNTQYLKDFYQEDVDYANSAEGMGAGALEGKKFVKGMTYDQFIQSHVVFFWKDPFGRLVRFINEDFKAAPGGCGKPVIYLYPEKTERVSVKILPSGGLTKTEPDYGSGWNVIADPTSRIKNLADGKTYSYLFWEGKSKEIYQMSRYGFVAGREELEGLLNDKLSKMGLIPKEISDFKEFWLPKMLAENKPYYFITFIPQRKIDKIAPLEISPKPDTVIRVLMDYKGLDEKIDAPGYDIKTPERQGFTAVEWGGVLK